MPSFLAALVMDMASCTSPTSLRRSRTLAFLVFRMRFLIAVCSRDVYAFTIKILFGHAPVHSAPGEDGLVHESHKIITNFFIPVGLPVVFSRTQVIERLSSDLVDKSIQYKCP